jgi:hypothetical protein
MSPSEANASRRTPWNWLDTTSRGKALDVSVNGELTCRSPVIDGHIDLPILVREFYGNNLSSFDLEQETVCLRAFARHDHP